MKKKMARDRVTKDRSGDFEPTDDVIAYPGPDEINNPPEDFGYYLKLFFGPKGSGKTTTMAEFPDSLTIQLEPKRRGLRIRQTKGLQVYSAKDILDGAPDTYQLIKNTTQQWLDDDSIKCLNYDSVDLFYLATKAHICAANGLKQPSEADKRSHEIWDEIREEFSSYFDALHDTDMQINMSSHIKEREEITLDKSKMGITSPSCTPACLKYLKQAVDMFIYQGWYDSKRAMLVRDTDNVSMVAPGVQGKFYQPNEEPLYIFEVPDLDKGGSVYDTLVDAFNCKVWDMDTPEEERKVKKRKVK